MSLLLRNVDIGTRINEIVRQPARIEQSHKLNVIRKPVEIIVIEDDCREHIDVMEKAKLPTQPRACPAIPEKLLGILQPHQIHGVEFMFKALTTSPEAHIKIYHGAILAHAQGLGKTLQVVTLAYMLAIHSETCNNAHVFPKHLSGGSKLRFLVLCPATVVENWANEFTKWLPLEAREYIRTCFYMLGGKASIDSCRRWSIAGGVMIMGYEMFRSFTTSSDAKYAEWKHGLLRADVVICDEAHRLKNQSSELYDAVEKIKTPARICLTGTPLQNNLEEYYCMINFVYPGYLYDLNDYRIRFAKPIMAGMDLDSSSSQIKLSRRKLYSLQKIIDPLVFRISIPSLSAEMDRSSASAVYESLMSSTKTEFVVKCKVLDFQKELYVTCLTELYGLKMSADGKFVVDTARKRNSIGKDLLACFYELMTIVNHPNIALKHFEKRKEKTLAKKEKKDAVAILEAASKEADSSEVVESTDEVEKEPDPLPIQLSLFKKIESMYEKLAIPSDDISLSIKAAVSLKICETSLSLNEKVLLFSRSLLTLDFMQKILEKSNLKLYRLDGSVAALDRISLVDKFNSCSEPAVFLISTQTGSLGINLPSSTRVILYDVGWNPVHDEQSVSRAFRFGQSKPVFVYRLHAADTMEDVVMKKNVMKLMISRLVVDKKGLSRGKFLKEELCDYFKNPASNIPGETTRQTAPVDELLAADPVMMKVYDEFKNDLVSVYDFDAYIKMFDFCLNEEEKREVDFFLTEEKEELGKLRRSKRLAEYRKQFQKK